ncbi:MAG: response regulator [Thermoproteota archaeon]|nr:response regulator [Thermoproteota archaeon]
MAPYSKNNKNNNYNENNNNNQKYKSKIMVLDDDFDIATIVKMTLQRYGFRNVSMFTEPSMAIREFRENGDDYSLVISDIRMPGINGFEFANYIYMVDPGIKVILMTAFNTPEDLLTMKSEYDAHNVTQIIQKPISPKKLAKIVSAL